MATRAERRRHDRATRRAGREHRRVQIEMALTPTPDPRWVREAQQVTHDTVLELAGDRRRSGVQWRIIGPGWKQLDVAIRQVCELTGRPDLIDGYLEHLAEHPLAVLVIATCDVAVPAGPNPEPEQ